MISRIIFILSILGLLVSAFLAYEYLQVTPMNCPLTGTGCDIVRKSDYSHFLGISIPYLGILFYVFMAAVSIWLVQVPHRLINRLRFAVSVAGLLFGIYLTYLEAFVIKAYCFWCLSSFMVSVLIFIFAYVAIRDENRN